MGISFVVNCKEQKKILDKGRNQLLIGIFLRKRDILPSSSYVASTTTKILLLFCIRPPKISLYQTCQSGSSSRVGVWMPFDSLSCPKCQVSSVPQKGGKFLPKRLFCSHLQPPFLLFSLICHFSNGSYWSGSLPQ